MRHDHVRAGLIVGRGGGRAARRVPGGRLSGAGRGSGRESRRVLVLPPNQEPCGSGAPAGPGSRTASGPVRADLAAWPG